MTYNNISYEKKNTISYLKLNRSNVDNAVGTVMAEELFECCQFLNQDDQIRVVIIKGEGKTFSSGIDLEDGTAPNLASSAIASIKCPVIASINGDATGPGLELILACDIRISSDNARFGFTEVSRGLIPSGGGTQRLPRIVGKGKALELVLTASMINADEAWRIGLVNQVVSPSELDEVVNNLAQKLVSKGPVSARYAKEAISKGMDMTLAQGLRLEADLSFLLQTTSDRNEGINAFNEKRTPEFKGN